MISYETLCENAQRLQERVSHACDKAGRSAEEVQILPVTKSHPIDILEYARRYGFLSVGENKVQEAMAKRKDYAGDALQWELIGHLQSNKAIQASLFFDRIQSVDSLKLASKLNQGASEAGLSLTILVQVNTGRDPNKYGFMPEELPEGLERMLDMPNLNLQGLMTIAPLEASESSPEQARYCFEDLRNLRDRMIERFGISLRELSMGMSADLETAVECGSTILRIGSALCGSRSNQHETMTTS